MGVLAVPGIALAQSSPDLGNIEVFVRSLAEIINLLLPVIFTLALLLFFWGLVTYVFAISRGDETAQGKGRSLMVGGIIALFVMASVWGIVAFIGDALGIRQGQSIENIPSVGPIRDL